MSTDRTRRGILTGSAAIGAGVALGAFTRTSLAAMPQTMSEGTFLDRFDRPLDDAAIRDLVVGNTLEGVTFNGGEFLAYIAPDGSVDKIIGERRDTGAWDIKDDMLGMQFTYLAQGRPFALRVFRHKDASLYKGWSPSEERWVWFVVGPGKGGELA